MNNISRIICLTLCIALLTLTACKADTPTPDIEIVEEESFFTEMKEEGGYVYYHCNITIKNNTDTPQNFMLKGFFNGEYEEGILSSSECYAISNDGTQDSFSLKSKETVEYLEIVFVMKKNESYTKDFLKIDRCLPKIKVIQN